MNISENISGPTHYSLTLKEVNKNIKKYSEWLEKHEGIKSLNAYERVESRLKEMLRVREVLEKDSSND